MAQRFTNHSAPRRRSKQLGTSFRRNAVVSSQEQREVAQHQQTVTQRQYERQRRIRCQRIRRRLLAGLLLLGVGFLAWRLSIGEITVVVPEQYQLSQDQTKQYQAALNEAVTTTTVGRQSWLLDQPTLQRWLSQRYPEIADSKVSYRQPFSRGLTVELSFRKPLFVWKDSSTNQQFIDNHGVLFSQQYERGLDPSHLIQIEDESGVVLELGTSVLTGQLVEYIGQLPQALAAAYGEPGLQVERVIIPVSTREIQVKVVGQPYVIKLSSERDLGEQLTELTSVVKFLNSQAQTPASFIDIRIPHKAFYK